MKLNAIMEQLDKSDGNRYQSKNNMNQFAPFYESENEESTKHRGKTKTPRITLRKK